MNEWIFDRDDKGGLNKGLQNTVYLNKQGFDFHEYLYIYFLYIMKKINIYSFFSMIGVLFYVIYHSILLIKFHH